MFRKKSGIKGLGLSALRTLSFCVRVLWDFIKFTSGTMVFPLNVNIPLRIFKFAAHIFLIITVFTSTVNAATYFVRCDGGTPSQCDGTHLAPLAGAVDGSDAGSIPDCALNSPNWLNGANAFTGGVAGLASGVDIVLIDGTLQPGCPATTSGRAEYEIGSGAPNMPPGNSCSAPGGGFPYGCAPNYWPAGSSPSSRFKLYGIGWNTGCKNPPQLWGSNAFGLSNSNYAGVISISSNSDIQCLEITDHSGCMARHHGAGNIDNSATQDPISCSETYTGSGPGRWAGTGIKIADSAHDILIKNVWAHGMALQGVHSTSPTGNIDLINFYDFKNGYVGWTGLDGGNFTGNYSWTFGTMAYSGCGQRYPPTYAIPRSRAQWRDSSDVHNCWTQGQGAGYGDGFGTSAAVGNWTIKRIDCFGNASDCIDHLYPPNASNTSQNKYIQNTCEGNQGSCFKSGSAANLEVGNNTLIGNCLFWKNSPLAYGNIEAPGRSGSSCNNNGVCNANENSTNCGDCPFYGYCRANTPLSINVISGNSGKIYGNTIESNFDVAIYLQGITAGGAITLRNNQIIGGQNYLNGQDMGDLSDGVYSDGAAVTINNNYMIQCGTKNIATACSGQPNSQCFSNCSSLNLAGTMMNNNPTFYQGINYLPSFFLTSSSPAHSPSAADETATVTGGDYDSTGFNRRSTWDNGGIEYRPALHLSTDEFRVDQ